MCLPNPENLGLEEYRFRWLLGETLYVAAGKQTPSYCCLTPQFRRPLHVQTAAAVKQNYQSLAGGHLVQ